MNTRKISGAIPLIATCVVPSGYGAFARAESKGGGEPLGVTLPAA